MSKRVKQFLNRFFKIFIIFMLVTLGINLMLLGVVYFNHKSKCGKESTYMVKPGEYVEVDGHQIHMLQMGNTDSDVKIVFLHSGMNTDDSIAVQPLFEKMSDYHNIYIDRSGYGFSHENGSPKDIESILEETREVLKQAGIEGPYYLVASGSGGIEAFYWADKYETEVAGIIGLGMYYPEQIAEMDPIDFAGFFDYVMSRFCSIGGMRLVSAVYPENYGEVYTSLQMKSRNAIIAQRGYTKDMFAENEATVPNAQKAKDLGFPEKVPMLVMFGNPITEPYINDDTVTKEKYDAILKADKESGETFDYVSEYNRADMEYFKSHENVSVAELSGPTRLYTYCPDKVADSIKEFIDAK